LTTAHSNNTAILPPKPTAQEGVARSVKTAGRIHISELMQLPYLKVKLTQEEKRNLIEELERRIVELAAIRRGECDD